MGELASRLALWAVLGGTIAAAGCAPLAYAQEPEPPTLAAPAERTVPPSVLAILAHPDDEITIAPVLARIAREGGEVTIAIATSGDAGQGVSGMEPGAQLAALREDEARCSASALGVSEPILWQLGDGTLSTFAHHPGSAAEQLLERISALINDTDPEVIITWGPDGGYGHADHRMVSNAVTQVVQAMPQSRPDLLYPALPATEDTPAELAQWAKTRPDLVTDRIRYEAADMQAMQAALDCHKSQFAPEQRAALPLLLHHRVWQGEVHFRQAFPPTP